MKDVAKAFFNLLFGGALFLGATPNTAVDLSTGQVDPVIHNGSGQAYVLTQPYGVPQYVVPMPDGGAGPSLYINPTPGEGE